MNKKFCIASTGGLLALALSAGAVLAQGNPQRQAMPPPSRATPAIPATPANPSMDRRAVPATPAQPNNTAANGPPFSKFKDLDTNGDGALSADEIAADSTLAADLAKYDTNGDGKLSESEYARYKNQVARKNTEKNPNDQR